MAHSAPLDQVRSPHQVPQGAASGILEELALGSGARWPREGKSTRYMTSTSGGSLAGAAMQLKVRTPVHSSFVACSHREAFVPVDTV